MTYTVSLTHAPPQGYGEFWERSSDPWHPDAFPEEVAVTAFTEEHKNSNRRGGWMNIDGYGNAVGFVSDESEFDGEPPEYEYKQGKYRLCAYVIGGFCDV